mmetsp:Transcript_130507/g.229805  ORF Transcript_130507/g.229805 Transcript_130507/m.229805 type:complete len:261 (-) Transcript_130507:1468-2250(-)
MRLCHVWIRLRRHISEALKESLVLLMLLQKLILLVVKAQVRFDDIHCFQIPVDATATNATAVPSLSHCGPGDYACLPRPRRPDSARSTTWSTSSAWSTTSVMMAAPWTTLAWTARAETPAVILFGHPRSIIEQWWRVNPRRFVCQTPMRALAAEGADSLTLDCAQHDGAIEGGRHDDDLPVKLEMLQMCNWLPVWLELVQLQQILHGWWAFACVAHVERRQIPDANLALRIAGKQPSILLAVRVKGCDGLLLRIHQSLAR